MPAFVLALPLVSSAQDFNYATEITDAIGGVVGALIPILVGLLVVVFAWGIVTYIWKNDDDAKAKGKSLMIWGVIGIALVVSIWGVVALLQDVFGITTGEEVDVPTVPGLNSTI